MSQSIKPPICDMIPLFPGCNPITTPQSPINPTNPNSPINPGNLGGEIAGSAWDAFVQAFGPVASKIGLFLLAMILAVAGLFIMAKGGAG